MNGFLDDFWRPKLYSELNKELLAEKLRRDKEYEQEVARLYKELPREEAIAQKKILWEAYLEWGKTSGTYYMVTPEEYEQELLSFVNSDLEKLNQVRQELGLKPYVLGVGK